MLSRARPGRSSRSPGERPLILGGDETTPPSHHLREARAGDIGDLPHRVKELGVRKTRLVLVLSGEAQGDARLFGLDPDVEGFQTPHPPRRSLDFLRSAAGVERRDREDRPERGHGGSVGDRERAGAPRTAQKGEEARRSPPLGVFRRASGSMILVLAIRLDERSLT